MFKNTNSKKMTFLLVALVLITSLFVGTTIARYVTNTSSQDEARVAVWGINTGGEEMDLFKNQYKLEDNTVIALSSDETENIIAPGLGGMSEFKIIEAQKAGLAPEVRYEVIIDLDDSEIADEIKNHPGIEWKVDNGEWGTWDEFKTSLLSLSGDASGYKVYAPGVMADEFANGETHTVAWQWIMDSGNDDLDTILANRVADGEDITAKLVINIIARQADGSTVGMINYDDTYNASHPSVMTFRSVADYSTFNGVKVNGTTLAENEEYTKEPGSIIIKLKESYLSRLTEGEYNIEILSTDETKTAKATFKVIDKFDISKVDSVLANNSWNTISEVAKLGKADDYWNVGDKTTVKVNGEEKEVVIIGFNHDGVNTVTFSFAEEVTTAPMNSEYTNSGSWSGSLMKTSTMETIYNGMENKDLLKTVEKQTIKGYEDGNSNNTIYELITTQDKLFLLSYTEVFSNDNSPGTWDDFNEGSQYKYFETQNNRIIKDSKGNAIMWWLRTPHEDNTDYFYLATNGNDTFGGTALYYSVIPAFVIG